MRTEAERLITVGDWNGAAAGILRAKEIWESLDRRSQVGGSWVVLARAKSLSSLDEGEATARQALTFAIQARSRISELILDLLLESISFLRGDLSEPQSAVASVLPTSPGLLTGPLALALRASRMEARGELKQAMALLPDASQFPAPTIRSAILASVARIQFNAGELEAARITLAKWQESYSKLSQDNLRSTDRLAVGILEDALPSLGTTEMVQDAYLTMNAFPSSTVEMLGLVFGADYMRGALGLRLGLIDEAEAHFRTGVDWAKRERAVLVEGRCLQGLAAVAEKRGDRQAQGRVPRPRCSDLPAHRREPLPQASAC